MEKLSNLVRSALMAALADEAFARGLMTFGGSLVGNDLHAWARIYRRAADVSVRS